MALPRSMLRTALQARVGGSSGSQFLTSRLSARAAPTTPLQPLLSGRTMSSSSIALQAVPKQETGPTIIPGDPIVTDPAAKRDAIANAASYANPYAKGPSAIDKAAHLFFFTEILRGERRATARFESRTWSGHTRVHDSALYLHLAASSGGRDGSRDTSPVAPC